MIKIDHVDKKFQTKNGVVHALKDVSLNVEAGDIYGVIGYSGAGKSTLIRMVNLLEYPDQGHVYINGKDIIDLKEHELNAIRKEIGMVFQQFNLLESQTVYQNIALPLILLKKEKKFIDQKVNELLSFVELLDKKDVYVSQLSGGQKQRIGIARALATNPKILLCDEATSALDPQTTESILLLLKKINQELGVTILLITHEMNVIKKICHKVAVMKSGEIVERGNTLDIFSHPHQEMTKRFVSTVINDKIPDSLIEELDSAYPILKLTFSGENTKEDIISEINQQFKIKTSILFASVNEIKDEILGILTIQIKGQEIEINKAIAYLKDNQVEIERVVLNHD